MRAARCRCLLDIIEAGRPVTIGEVFYQGTVRGLRCGPLGVLRQLREFFSNFGHFGGGHKR
jgi:hypothetical protein